MESQKLVESLVEIIKMNGETIQQLLNEKAELVRTIADLKEKSTTIEYVPIHHYPQYPQYPPITTPDPNPTWTPYITSTTLPPYSDEDKHMFATGGVVTSGYVRMVGDNPITDTVATSSEGKSVTIGGIKFCPTLEREFGVEEHKL